MSSGSVASTHSSQRSASSSNSDRATCAPHAEQVRRQLGQQRSDERADTTSRRAHQCASQTPQWTWQVSHSVLPQHRHENVQTAQKSRKRGWLRSGHRAASRLGRRCDGDRLPSQDNDAKLAGIEAFGSQVQRGGAKPAASMSLVRLGSTIAAKNSRIRGEPRLERSNKTQITTRNCPSVRLRRLSVLGGKITAEAGKGDDRRASLKVGAAGAGSRSRRCRMGLAVGTAMVLAAQTR